MPRENLPHIQFYVGDWRRDVGIQSLSYHYRGIWFELLMLMHCSEQRGKLVLGTRPMSDDSIARLLGLSHGEWTKARQVLVESAVASRDSDGTLYCRRMVREEEIRQSKIEAGRKGGLNRGNSLLDSSKPQAKPKQTPDIDNGNDSGQNEQNPQNVIRSGKDKAQNLGEVTAFCREIGLPRADAEWFWHKCEANGWTNGGKRMLDWRQTLRSWKAGGYVPSIKNPEKGKPPRARTEQPRKRDKQFVVPVDPAKEADFRRKLKEWQEKGRPLGEFPT
jgi:uncharacterized protein YdaU (DUF1376 family)